MKRTVVALMVLAQIADSLSARDIDLRMQRQCEYYLYDSGRYSDLMAGYTLGIVQGMKYMIPEKNRSSVAQRRLGYLTDTVCLKALNNKTRAGFEAKFKRAAYQVLSK